MQTHLQPNYMKTLLPLIVITLLMVGCASVSVDDRSVQVTGKIAKPKAIYVQTFDTSNGEWNVDRTGQELVEFKKNAGLELQRMMVERFPEIAPTYPIPAKLPSSGLLVTGEFTRVNQGSRALRMGIGFGAGGTKVETTVRIYDLSISQTDPIATFKTTGGSNAQPGWLAGGWIAGGINGTGLQDDWERTSREIRNFILDRIK